MSFCLFSFYLKLAESNKHTNMYLCYSENDFWYTPIAVDDDTTEVTN